MNKFKSLVILDKIKFLFEKIGVDYKTMRSIIEIKLIMDSRRSTTALGSYENKDKGYSFFVKSLFSYGLIGLFIMFTVILPLPIYVKMSLNLSILMFMLLTTMISDFSAVLLDIKSKNILLSRPIDEKTYNMAKIVHIFIYMISITSIMVAPSLIAGSINHGVKFFMIYFIETIFIAALTVFLASLLYSLILKYFDGEKLKDIINYFQIVLSVVMIIGYQLVGRMFNFIDINITVNPKWWSFILPPAWFAAPYEVIMNGNSENIYIYLSLLAVIMPIILLLIHIKLVMPHFESNLTKLNSSERGSSSAGKKQKIYKFFANIFCFRKIEKAFFRFSCNLMSNERKLKLRIYPNLAFAAIFPFLMLLDDVRRGVTIAEFLSMLNQGKAYFGIYLSIFMMSATIMIIETSENYKGAWIYKALPLESPGYIFKGAIKAYIFKFYIGVLTVVSLIFLFLYKFSIILDIVLIFINMMLITALVFKTSIKSLPFSENANRIQKQGVGSVFLMMFIVGVSAGLHFFMKFNTIAFTTLILVTLIVTLIIWKKVFKIKWDQIV